MDVVLQRIFELKHRIPIPIQHRIPVFVKHRHTFRYHSPAVEAHLGVGRDDIAALQDVLALETDFPTRDVERFAARDLIGIEPVVVFEEEKVVVTSRQTQIQMVDSLPAQIGGHVQLRSLLRIYHIELVLEQTGRVEHEERQVATIGVAGGDMVVQFGGDFALHAAIDADLRLHETQRVQIRLHVRVLVQQILKRGVFGSAVHPDIQVQHLADQSHLQLGNRIDRALGFVVLVQHRHPDTQHQVVLADTEPHRWLQLEHEAVLGTTHHPAAVRAHRDAVAPGVVKIVKAQVQLIVLISRDFQKLFIVGQNTVQADPMLHVLPTGVDEVVIHPHILFQPFLLGGVVGTEPNFRMHVVEIVLDAVAVFFTVIVLGIQIELRPHPIRGITVQVGEFVVVADGRVKGIVLENAVEEQMYARVARGRVGVFLLLLADGFSP